MRHAYRLLLPVLGCVLLAACAEEAVMTEPRPLGTARLGAPIPDNSLYLFRDRDFHGDVARLDNLTRFPEGSVNQLPDDARGVTAARWKLPSGVLVLLHQRDDGTGEQAAFWGDGQLSTLTAWRTNDKVAYWSWHYVGGTGSTVYAVSPRPPSAQPTGAVAPGAIELFKDRDFHGTLTTIGPVDTQAGAQYHRLTPAADNASSVRWNLPPGVVVVLYEDATGTGHQLTLFGSGQYPALSAFNLNDRVSRWAWYDLNR